MNELAKAAGDPAIRTMDDLARLAEMFARSGFFKDSKDAAQCGVRILAGAELGYGPFQSINGVHIIQGRPSYSANLIAATVKRSGRYTYRVKEHTEQRCELTFLERDEGKWVEIGSSLFTLEDAKKANLLNNPTWRNYPRNMLFSRALTNGVRWNCPDVFGFAVYSPDELGAELDADGNILEAEVVVEEPKPVEAKVEEVKLSQGRADAMTKELDKLGYDVDATLELVAQTVRKGVVKLTELSDADALAVWNAAKRGSKARLALLEEQKQPWERWTSDNDATAYAAGMGREHGIFPDGGGQMMTLWNMTKNTVHENLYAHWYELIGELVATKRQAA